MRLIIELNDGVAPFLTAIRAAKKTVQIAVFRFDHKVLEAALKTAAAKGVEVTASIAHGNEGGRKSLRDLETRCLDAGITVTRSVGHLTRHHDKFFLVDGRVLIWMVRGHLCRHRRARRNIPRRPFRS